MDPKNLEAASALYTQWARLDAIQLDIASVPGPKGAEDTIDVRLRLHYDERVRLPRAAVVRAVRDEMERIERDLTRLGVHSWALHPSAPPAPAPVPVNAAADEVEPGLTMAEGAE
jgi:hypothetical protein